MICDSDNTDRETESETEVKAEARSVDPRLLKIMVCPLTRGALVYDRAAQELISHKAGLAYPVRDGIPILIIDEARVIDSDKL